MIQVWLFFTHFLVATGTAHVSSVRVQTRHPALGALGMGGDLIGRARTRLSNFARSRGSGVPSDQCDPHAVTMTAIPADPSKEIVVNSTVYAQWAWSSAAAQRTPP